jgi:phage tail protein X
VHEKIAGDIVEQLNKPGHTQAYPEVRAEKEVQAQDLIREHQPKLRPGIGLRVIFPDATRDRGDKDIDFEVVIAPNTTRRTGATPLDNRFYPNGFHPSSRPMDLLWLDASPNSPLLHGEEIGQVPVRVQLAREELRRRYGNQALIVDAILAANDGQTPRPFVSAGAEDALGLQDGHIIDRHVLSATRTRLDLARRILEPGPQHNARSSAFNSVADADAAIAAWMARTVSGANWPAFRDLLLTGGTYQEALATPGAAAWGISLRRAQGVQVPIHNPAARPDSLGGSSGRQAYPNENPALGAPMTVEVQCQRVTVRVIPDAAAPGGWFVHSAWPS